MCAQAYTSQKCCLCEMQVVRFSRSRLEICWQHGLVERDLSSAKNILNRAKALINGDDSANYLSAPVGGLDWKPLVITRKSAGVRMMSRAAFQAEWEQAERDVTKRTRNHKGLKKLLALLTSGAVVLEAEARPVLPPILRKGVKAVREKRQRMLANRDNSRRRLEFKALVHGADSEKFTAMRTNDKRARTIRDGRRKFWPLLRAAPLDARKRYDGLELNRLISPAPAAAPADVDADVDTGADADTDADVATGAVVDADADTGAVVDGNAVDTDFADSEVANAASRDTDDDAPLPHGTVPQTALVSPALPTLRTGGAAARF